MKWGFEFKENEYTFRIFSLFQTIRDADVNRESESDAEPLSILVNLGFPPSLRLNRGELEPKALRR